MPLNKLLKRASSFILGNATETTTAPRFHDGEVVFCKNNVCVHPPSVLRQECDVLHHPGYLTVVCQRTTAVGGVGDGDDDAVDTLRLAWIPNTTLRRNPWAVENLPATPTATPTATPAGPGETTNDGASGAAAGDNPRGVFAEGGGGGGEESTDGSLEETDRGGRSPSLGSASGLGVARSGRRSSGDNNLPSWMSSPELLALQHNLTFPDSATASPVVRRAHRCRRFSVDLSRMRSVRLFFNDGGCTCGQLVVASRESQYKILHFHWGGLDRLASVLQEWNFLRPSEDNSWPYRHFMVCRPEVSRDELHPEDGLVGPVDEATWKLLLNESGQLEDDLALRKGVFFGGLSPSMRRVVWPFLLHCYTFQSTREQREQILHIRRQEYEEITRRRLEMDPESREIFRRNVQCVIEKDVVRTDRGNPYFAGDDNPNIEVMKNVLLNYAAYNPGFGYTQGMSDLLAPVLAEIRSEPDAFWCFVGLMHKTLFVCTPTDMDMDRNLCFLRELIRLMVPDFHAHLARHPDAMELLFCHRWILLCFKREFPEPLALKMWEACWANYLTDYFHLFLCLAIVCVYSDDVIGQDLRPDEMLLHFSSLSMFMDGDVILSKARGLLHKFRQMPCIPCTLGSLCQLCGPGMWDSTHAPVVECTGDHGPLAHCPHRAGLE